MRSKALAIILSIAMIVTVAPATAFAAADSGSGDDQADGTVTAAASNTDSTAADSGSGADQADSTVTAAAAASPAAAATNPAGDSGSAADPFHPAIGNPRMFADRGVSAWDCIYFGNYPQSAGEQGSYVTEPILWRVLSVEDTDSDGIADDAFLMADRMLDRVQYNLSESGSAWKDSHIRKWMNDENDSSSFIRTAFDNSERAAIKTTAVVNNNGGNTSDKVYALSADEARSAAYGFAQKGDKVTNPTRIAGATDYVNRTGVTYWLAEFWLRTSTDGLPDSACYVPYNGKISDAHVMNELKARPVLHMDLSQTNCWKYAGIVEALWDMPGEDEDAYQDTMKYLLTDIELPNEILTYTGEAVEPEVTVKHFNRVLTDEYYTVSYSNNVKAGTATVTVTGKSDGLGSVEKQFTISPAVVNRDDITITPEKALYTGKPVTLESVKYKGKELTEGVDYTVVYYNNINVTTEGSKATAVITFRGNYYGTVGKTFEIGSVITDAVITDVMLPADSCEYNGREQRPEPIVKSWDTVLEKDKDYTVTYKDNIDPGRATVTVTGTGETATDQATGEGQGAGTDQTAGAYKGVITKHFDIVRADIARGETTLEWTKTLYNGKDQRPAVTIVLDGSELREGYDYSVKYADNKEIGRATATVKGIGNYTGTVTKVFKILDSRIANARIQVNPSTVQYDGKPQTPAVYVYLGEKILTEKEEYTLSYSDNTEPGTATVTIKGIGHYEGTATAAFTIEGTKPAGDDAKPSDDDTKKVTVKATGITKLSKIRKGFTVSWKKSTAANATGYQVRYSTKSSMAGAKSIKVKGYKNTVKKITKLKAKKKYYVQVRVYKVKNGKTYYSKWSAKKWVKTL